METHMARVSGFLARHVAERYSVSPEAAGAGLLYLARGERRMLFRHACYTAFETRMVDAVYPWRLPLALGMLGLTVTSPLFMPPAAVPYMMQAALGTSVMAAGYSFDTNIAMRNRDKVEERLGERLKQFLSEGWDVASVGPYAEATGKLPESRKDIEIWRKDSRRGDRAQAVHGLRAVLRGGNAGP
jgi:hypothetical protein